MNRRPDPVRLLLSLLPARLTGRLGAGVLAALVAGLTAWSGLGPSSSPPAERHIEAPADVRSETVRAPAGTSIGWIARSELPPEAIRVLTLIKQGGPFPYDRDGIVFQNRERLLPVQARGYYTEYTVPTPGLDHRGARRIVAAGPPAQSDELYYSADHYRSFRRIRAP